MVTEFLETSKVKLVFLPPYSLNLNFIERLWKFIKNKIIYNQYLSKLSTLLTNNFRMLEGVQSESSFAMGILESHKTVNLMKLHFFFS
ncbi:MAG: transposase [Chthoniobacterales bacterium]|nr:transposase [Chthoniobacterales bacterium]